MVVRGWALNPEPLRAADRLCFTLGRPERAVDLSYGQERNDVARAMNDPSCAAAGFKQIVPLDGLALGTHTLRIMAIDEKRCGYYELDDERTLVIVESRRLFSGTSPVVGRMQFGIERLETTSGRRDLDGKTLRARIGDIVIASGWAIDMDRRCAAGDVFGVVDGDRYVLAVNGMPRAEVAAGFGAPSARACGFALRIRTSTLSAGLHDLSLAAVAREGNDYEVIPLACLDLR